MTTFTALFDACVLYQAPVRDLLLHLSGTDLFRAKWTNQIHDEWIENLLRNRPDLTLAQITRTRGLMDKSVPDCLVHGYEHFIAVLDLPDQNDRHVLAAAIKARADVLVTFNLSDFPNEVLAAHDVEAQHPDEFISHLIDLSPAIVCGAVKRQRAALKNPPRSVEELLQTFEALGLAQTVEALSEFSDLL